MTLSAFTNDFLFFFVDVLDVLSIAALSVLQRQQQRIYPGIDISAPQVCEQRRAYFPRQLSLDREKQQQQQPAARSIRRRGKSKKDASGKQRYDDRTHAPLEVLPRLSTRLLHLSSSSACAASCVHRPCAGALLSHFITNKTKSVVILRRSQHTDGDCTSGSLRRLPTIQSERSPSSQAAENASFFQGLAVFTHERGASTKQ